MSNSSSSSFICEVSGRVESGWDLPLEDAGMFTCANDHTVSDEYRLEVAEEEAGVEETLKKFLQLPFEEACEPFKEFLNPMFKYDRDGSTSKKALRELIGVNASEGFDAALEHLQGLIDEKDEDSDSRYEVNPRECPICQMTKITDSDLLSYMLMENGKLRSMIEDEIRAKYGNYDAFCEALREARKSVNKPG